MKISSKIFIVLFIILAIIFCYLRLQPIILQDIPYTYDQGRDFLKAEEIVKYKNITFIGPTTGVVGIYHGAWWYYFLSVPYFLTSGHPMGFAIFIFVLALMQFVLFSLFIKKKFSDLAALTFAGLVAISPYFIFTSYFVISSVFVFPFLLLFFYFLYKFLETKNTGYIFLIFLNLAMVLEAEVPTGIFTILAFLISITALRQLKVFFPSLKSILYAIAGFIIPIVPRMLFEVKNNFPELKIALDFVANPKYFDPKPIHERLIDRLYIFYKYYIGLFPGENILLGILVVGILITGFVVGFKKFSTIQKSFVNIIAALFGFLFFLSLLYKDNFWANYYEGLTFYFALFIAIAIYGWQKNKFIQPFLNYVPILLILLLTLLGLFNFFNIIKSSNSNKISGMKSQITVVENIYQKVGQEDFCVRIYTPPVIPYTYDYLFSYYSRVNQAQNYSKDFVNNRCYFIMEKEQSKDYEHRIIQWRKQNTPSDAQLIKQEVVGDRVNIETWNQK